MVRIGEKGDLRRIWVLDEDSIITLARTRPNGSLNAAALTGLTIRINSQIVIRAAVFQLMVCSSPDMGVRAGSSIFFRNGIGDDFFN